MFFSREGELRAFKLLAERGFGPALLATLEGGRVEEFLEGKVCVYACCASRLYKEAMCVSRHAAMAFRKLFPVVAAAAARVYAVTSSYRNLLHVRFLLLPTRRDLCGRSGRRSLRRKCDSRTSQLSSRGELLLPLRLILVRVDLATRLVEFSSCLRVGKLRPKTLIK